MPRGQYERTPERLAYMRVPFTCPKCRVTFPSSAGKGTHLRYCGTQDDTLLAKIDKNHPSGCWIYKGATDRRGYGRPCRMLFGGGRKRYYAHRRSYEIHKGPIPEGMLVLHKCDNPPCCNPEHLFLGTDADNVWDKMRKGRHACKLTEDQVREIKRLLPTTPQKDLAKRFKISATMISSIYKGTRWGHIT